MMDMLTRLDWEDWLPALRVAGRVIVILLLAWVV